MNKHQQGTTPRSVLIVDDIEQNLYLLNFMLNNAGYRTLQARNGKQALVILEKQTVDLIISDILMPEMDGYQFCRTCKAHDTWRDIPFIFYTATYTTDEDKQLALRLGAARFMIKPQEPNVFLDAIKEVLQQLQQHQLHSPATIIDADAEYLTLYNQRLVKKLEDKLVQLEERNQQLDEELASRRAAETRVDMLKQTLAQADEAFLIFDSKEQLVFVNQAYSEISGYSRESLMQPARKLKSCPGLSEFCRMHCRHALIRQQRWNGPLQLKKAGGDVFPALISAVPVFAGEREVYLAVIIRDISELKQMEAQFHEAQKMDAVGKLAGGIAHDFNNMLAAISMNAYLMRVMPGDSRDTRERLQLIESACERSREMTQQLLTFARKDHPKIKSLDLVAVVNKTVKLAQAATNPEISLQVRNDESSLPIRGNANQIEHMLLNLLTNAGDALEGVTEPCIEVGTETRCVHPAGASGEQRYAVVTVSDNGCGIDTDKRDHIFEPFMTTKEIGKGTGLGLAMVHGAMENHFGYIDVQSDNNGSCFSLFFPLQSSRNDDGAVSWPRTVDGNSRLLLLADDNPFFLEAIGKVLGFLDFRVIYASNGEKALALFKHKRADGESIAIAMLDIVMPKMNGIETAQQLRAEQPELPILFTTGYAENVIPADLPGLHHSRMLVKPFAPESLCRELAAALGESPAQQREELP